MRFRRYDADVNIRSIIRPACSREPSEAQWEALEAALERLTHGATADPAEYRRPQRGRGHRGRQVAGRFKLAPVQPPASPSPSRYVFRRHAGARAGCRGPHERDSHQLKDGEPNDFDRQDRVFAWPMRIILATGGCLGAVVIGTDLPAPALPALAPGLCMSRHHLGTIWTDGPVRQNAESGHFTLGESGGDEGN